MRLLFLPMWLWLAMLARAQNASNGTSNGTTDEPTTDEPTTEEADEAESTDEPTTVATENNATTAEPEELSTVEVKQTVTFPVSEQLNADQKTSIACEVGKRLGTASCKEILGEAECNAQCGSCNGDNVIGCSKVASVFSYTAQLNEVVSRRGLANFRRLNSQTYEYEFVGTAEGKVTAARAETVEDAIGDSPADAATKTAFEDTIKDAVVAGVKAAVAANPDIFNGSLAAELNAMTPGNLTVELKTVVTEPEPAGGNTADAHMMSFSLGVVSLAFLGLL